MSDTPDTPRPVLRVLEPIARRPRLAALLGAMCIAFSGVFYRFADVSPSTGLVFRALWGLPLLAVVAAWEQRRYGTMSRRSAGLAIVAGAFFTGDLFFWHHSIENVGAGLATVLGNLQVLVVGVAAWLVLGERPSRPVIVAVPVVLLGAVLISGVVGAGAYGANPPLGVVFGLITALCYAAYLLIVRSGTTDVRRPAGPVLIATASTAACGTLVGILTGELDPLPPLHAMGWLVVYGITSQSLGYLLISLSLPRLPAVLTSIILLSQPVATVGLGIVLLGEHPSAIQLGGVALIVGGILFATLARRVRRGAAAPRAQRPAQVEGRQIGEVGPET